MSILSIGEIKFAKEEYTSSGLTIQTFPTAEATTRESFLSLLHAGHYDGVVAVVRHLHDKTIGRLDGDVISQLPASVRVIANIGAGYDQIDVPAATARGVYVTNTPDAVRESTADTALFLLLAVLRNFPAGMAAVARPGESQGWVGDVAPGRCPSSRTIGVLGMGSIGRAIVTRCLALGATDVQYHNRSPSPECPSPELVRYVDFDTLLRTSDVLIVSVPLSKGTTHLLDREAFARMRRGSVLINTARGPIVDEEAMVAALEDGTLAGAGLDVFEHEPVVHEGLKRPGCVLLPHMGTHTLDASKLMEVQSLENLQSILAGGRKNIVPEQRDCHF